MTWASEVIMATLVPGRSEEHTSELQYQIISYAVFCLKKKKDLKYFYTFTNILAFSFKEKPNFLTARFILVRLNGPLAWRYVELIPPRKIYILPSLLYSD